MKERIDELEAQVKFDHINSMKPSAGPSKRRSTKKSGKVNSNKSAVGDSSFDHASESEIGSSKPQENKQAPADSDDRSELGFTSEDETDVVPQTMEAGEGRKPAKLMLND